jgi:hypothetical protein
MASNHITGSLSTETIQAVLDCISKLHELMPFLINLSPDERNKLPRIGDKSRAFVGTAVTLAVQHPEILPRGFNADDFAVSAGLVESLSPIRMALDHLQSQLEDSYLAAGCDAFSASRQVYSFAKAAHISAGGFDGGLEDLSRRFARRARSSDKSGNSAVTENH